MNRSFSKRIVAKLGDTAKTIEATAEACTADIERGAVAMASAIAAGGKIMYCGNGGSAADAQHLAAEFTNRLRSDFDRQPLAALALTTDTSFLTANGNDYGFHHIFERQVAALGKSEDVLVGISTSGNSPNVVRAVEQARQMKIATIGYLGGTGGDLRGLVDIAIVVPSDLTQHIQEAHITIGHIMVELVEIQTFGR